MQEMFALLLLCITHFTTDYFIKHTLNKISLECIKTLNISVHKYCNCFM